MRRVAGENELHGGHPDCSFLAIDELRPDDALALLESFISRWQHSCVFSRASFHSRASAHKNFTR
jgi:hypothetical protein